MDGVPGQLVPLTLRFLTDNESYRDFARRYWAAHFTENRTFYFPENVSTLAASFGWTLYEVIGRLREIVIVSYGTCTECKQPVTFKNRTDLHRNFEAAICCTCWGRRKEAEKQARDEQYRREKEEYQRQLAARPQVTAPRQMTQGELRQMYLDRLQVPAPIDADRLTLEDAVYLTAAFRGSQSEYLHYVLPLNKTWAEGFQNPVTPGSLFTTAVIDHLHTRKLLGIASCSPHDAFNWDTDDRPTGCNFDKAIWRIAPSAIPQSALIRDVESLFHKADLPSSWHADVLPIWRKIALHECMEFLKHQLAKHGLPFTPGAKTRMVVEDGLTTYSVSQIYNAVYRAAKDAAAYYMEKSSLITRQHAANTVVGRIQGFIEYARVKKWDVTRFRRNFDCPRSEVSCVLFDAVLKIGDAGFDERPRALEAATA